MTIMRLRCLAHNSFVCSICDSTEVSAQESKANHRMVMIGSQGCEGQVGVGINPVVNRHYELQIKTPQNVPGDAVKLKKLLQLKEWQKMN
jgi:hypothetical protein